MRMFLTALSVLLAFNVFTSVHAADYTLERNISYVRGDTITKYQKSRCKLDIYYPTNVESFPTVVWIHGGGMRQGNKYIPERYKEQGFAVVAINYRLNPKVKAPTYIEDAAAAVAWTFKNIGNYGGDPTKIAVAGMSAGGYLTSMIGLDKRWLAVHDIDADDIAALLPYSGHCITHFTVRSERGIKDVQAVVDDLAPLYHVRADAPPILLITGDRDLEMLGRYEENAYMWRMLTLAGHPNVELHELEGFNHGQMTEPADPLAVRFLRDIFGLNQK